MVVLKKQDELVWKKRTTREQWINWFYWLIGISIVLFAWKIISDKTIWFFVQDAPRQAADIGSRMVPPKWSYSLELIKPVWDTLNIATLGTVIAMIIAVPVAFCAARNTTPHSSVRIVALFIIVASRSVNSLIWALMLVFILGPGVLAGTVAIGLRSIGFCAKLIYESIEEIAHIEDELKKENNFEPKDFSLKSSEEAYNSNFSKADFLKAVSVAKDYIVDGDVMQVVLAQDFSKEFTHEPFDLYQALRFLNPSPYMYFLNFGICQVVGASPEILVRLQGDKVTLRPIAGTRRRGSNDIEDEENAKDLLSDPKELAEHLMLIDLGRNDVGKISEMGTVKVSEKMVIEKYSHVMHIVSNVEGSKKEDLSFIDVLKSALPAGTLSGAPKIRAMEIINELEPSSRGIYGGAIGHISWDGDIDTAIAIRTAVIKNNKIHVGAGAGIVADSIPENEWNECLQKAHVFLDAIEMIK